jgi:hypothetical protein
MIHLSSNRVLRALYNHGPCSVATVAAVVGETDPDVIQREVNLSAIHIGRRRVALPGLGVEPVDLLYLRGFGVG